MYRYCEHMNDFYAMHLETSEQWLYCVNLRHSANFSLMEEI
jgi:hypothetical protein